MAAQIVSQVLSQLGSIITEELKQRGRLVLGAEKDVKKLTSTFTAIEALLLDAEERQLKDKSVEDWLNKLKDMTYEIDDVLDEWRTEILKRQLEADLDDDDDQHIRRGCLELKLLQISEVLKRVCPFLPAYCFSPGEIGLRYDIASRIKELNECLDDIAAEKDRYNFTPRHEKAYQSLQTSSNINFSEVKGREEETNYLRHKLLDDGDTHQGGYVQSISIQGTGGLGKTTLAKLLYNDGMVQAHFEKLIWVCVSDNFDEVRVAKAILESLSGSTPQSSTLSYILEQIRLQTRGKRFLMVLDDVWEDSRSKWEEIRNSVSCGSLAGSKILVTTRKEEVSRALGCKDIDILRINKMTEDVCWAIFARVAFHGWNEEEQERVEDLCDRVVKKCYGSPLAAKVLGGVMQSKRSKREWVQLLGSEMWELKEGREEVLGPLALSYYDLPPAVRQCFQFCSVFPKDYKMEMDELIRLWMSQGFLKETENRDMEGIGKHYFEVLAMRSLFQDVEKRDEYFMEEWFRERTYCKMHDLVHDFARLISKNECISMTNRERLTPIAPSSISSSGTEIRHLMIEYSTDSTGKNIASVDSSQFSWKKHNYSLRSFIARNADKVEPDLGNHLRGIKSLVLYSCGLKEISSTISQLIHLRYLDLSVNKSLRELPEELCELFNLETLLLNNDWYLKKLPSGMGNKLVNLKHLENAQVPAVLPKSIWRLTSLKTLTMFKVVDGEEGAADIGDLENMNKLQGCLCVTGLSKVADSEKVKRAQLDKKESLTRLLLNFESQKREASDHEEKVLEAIRPPSTSLERLDVLNYRGGSINPSWLMSLSNLTNLKFSRCHQVEHLPPLGALPSLEQLCFDGMLNVKMVGREFLFGTSSVKQQQQHQQKQGMIAKIAFPKLRVLRFLYMPFWKVWELEWDDTETVMPRLRRLSLKYCGELEKLPDVLLRKASLEKLEIKRSGGFGSYSFDYKMVPRGVWNKISHIPTLIFDDTDIRTTFKHEIEIESTMAGNLCFGSQPFTVGTQSDHPKSGKRWRRMKRNS